MSAQRPGSGSKRPQPVKRPFVLPLAAGLVMLTIVREGMPGLWPEVNPWVVFLVALALGYAAYAATEQFLMRREQQKHRSRQP